MRELHLNETVHLERWITENPSLLGDDLMVVTTQFNLWESDSASARERLDVLALSTSGELVVIELKRESYRKIHLQALTYGALVAGFTKAILASAHARWLQRDGGAPVSDPEALQALERHVESEWSEELFGLPRLILVAESFPPQVLTTVHWLSAIAPTLSVECHEYQLFTHGSEVVATFQMLYPVDDLQDRRLRPVLSTSPGEVREQLQDNRRRAKSVTIIHEHGLIPSGADVQLELRTRVRAEIAEKIEAWLAEEPARGHVTWASDPTRPLVWELQPEKRWTPSALRNEIFALAGVEAPTFSAADAWSYQGCNLYTIADGARDDGSGG